MLWLPVIVPGMHSSHRGLSKFLKFLSPLINRVLLSDGYFLGDFLFVFMIVEDTSCSNIFLYYLFPSNDLLYSISCE